MHALQQPFPGKVFYIPPDSHGRHAKLYGQFADAHSAFLMEFRKYGLLALCRDHTDIIAQKRKNTESSAHKNAQIREQGLPEAVAAGPAAHTEKPGYTPCSDTPHSLNNYACIHL